jgi:hypothetical protein
MNLPSEITAAIIKAAGKELADRVSDAVEDLQLVTIRKAAEILCVSEPMARKLIREYVELGEASRRVRLSTLRRIIEERTIRL